MEPNNFWDAAFGGKNNLILSLDAHTFRVRKNKWTTTYSFRYDTNKMVRIRFEDMFLYSPRETYFMVGLEGGKVFYKSNELFINMVAPALEHLTGYALHPFGK